MTLRLLEASEAFRLVPQGGSVALKPRLIVVDSICGGLDFEEGGNPVQTNRMYLGTDAVQLDAYGRSLMGLNPGTYPILSCANGTEEAGWPGYREMLYGHGIMREGMSSDCGSHRPCP